MRPAPTGEAAGCRFYKGNMAFTLIELLVVVAIIAILAALLFPVAGRMVAASQAAKCSSNMRNVALGMLSYAGDNNGQLPMLGRGGALNPPNWMDEILPYVAGGPTNGRIKGSPKPFGNSFYCPSSKNPHPYGSYGPHPCLVRDDYSTIPSMRLIAIPKPARTVLLSECYSPPHPQYSSSWYFPLGQASKTYLPQPHGGSLNMAYCDGHIASMKHQEAADNYAAILGLPLP